MATIRDIAERCRLYLLAAWYVLRAHHVVAGEPYRCPSCGGDPIGFCGDYRHI